VSIQILGIRTFTKKTTRETITTDCFHSLGWRAPDIPTLFRELPRFLEQIPEKDRFNLFYTVARCTDQKRIFAALDVIAFDIDEVPEEARRTAALATVGALGLDPGKTAWVSSGGGVHVIVQLAEPITDREFFKAHKADYGHACERIASALKTAGVPFKAVDPTIFEPRRILRLPGTENRKPGREPRACVLMQPNMLPQAFDLRRFSPTGGPVKKEDAVPPRALARYGKTDTPAVLQGCEFLKWAAAEPGKVNEPQWYAALSIVGRLSPHQGKDAAAMCHDLSRGHPGYEQDITDRKIAQALDASGPRTCHNINQLWRRCGECPHFEKVGSPILLVSPEKIRTELTGFHQISGNGKLSPCPADLRLFLRREHPYRSMSGSRTVYAWNGKHY
jgi:hypothetical protein